MNMKSSVLNLSFLIFVAFLFPTGLLAQSLACDADHVSLRNGVINVSPTGIDDTGNIQCALDAAKSNGIPKVRLNRSNYFISHVQISNFNGTLEGTTRDDTVLVILNNSIDCDAMIDDGQAPAGIKFISGDARIRFMTYGAETPCKGSQPDVFFLIHFTGGNAFDNCGNDTGFGVVDRVNLVSVAPVIPGIRGVGVGAEGTYFGTCKDTLLGTFKLNRSLLGFFRIAVQLGIRASGQVDVNFNEFADNLISIAVVNASQLLTVQGNIIVKSEDFNDDFFGISLITNEFNAPPRNRLVIHNNVFGIEERFTSGLDLLGVFAAQELTMANISLVATDNDFLLMGDEIWGFAASDISGGIFANNDMDGNADIGFYLEGDDTTSRDWSITGNSFRDLFSETSDIYLNSGSVRAIVGPAQSATISDFGTGNIILGTGGQTLESTAASNSNTLDKKVASTLARLRPHSERIASLLNTDLGSASIKDNEVARSNHSESLSVAEKDIASISSITKKLERIIDSTLD